MYHEFKNYGAGCRYVRITHGGQDGVFWAGHFGTRITLTSVIIKLNANESRDAKNHGFKENNSSSDEAIVSNNAQSNLSRKQRAKRAREVRFFVSSTFKDFITERDHLSRSIFYDVRAFCEKRNVAFSEIDLRWGALDSKDVIQLCMTEIDRSRPYYMCMLGERYGWCVTGKQEDEQSDKFWKRTADNAIECFKELRWISNLYDRSVTELEIRHACLNTPKDSISRNHAQFYFRIPGPQHIGNDFEYESDFHKQRMLALKQDIIDEGFEPTYFHSPEELGKGVLNALLNQIAVDFPTESKPSELDIERELHNNFAAFRARCYLPVGNYFEQLNAHITDWDTEKPPLLIVGESGSGKSALLANWWMSSEETLFQEPSILIVTHYIGSTADSTNHFSLLRRIMNEIKTHLLLPQEVPTEHAQILKAFPTFLHILSARCKMVLIIDALNQLEDRFDVFNLSWLPSVFPKNIRVFVSSLPGKNNQILNICKERQWPTVQVDPLTVNDTKELVRRYLAQYGKQMYDDLTDKIAHSDGGKSPLFVRCLLEELRMDALWETLQEKIDYYLQAKTNEDFFTLMLNRLEKHHEHEDTQTVGIFQKIFTAIGTSRQGMSESELLSITGLPRIKLQPIFNLLREFLISRSGYLTFFHDHLRFAVQRKYLSTSQAFEGSHLSLANFFQEWKPEVFSEMRRADELPFHFAELKDYQGLVEIIADLKVLKILLTPEREYDLLDYWEKIQNQLHIQPVQVYRERINLLEQVTSINNNNNTSIVTEEVIEAMESVGRLMTRLGDYREAEKLFMEAMQKRKALERNNSPATNQNAGTMLLRDPIASTILLGMVSKNAIPVRHGDRVILKTFHGTKIMSVLHCSNAKERADKIIRYGDEVKIMIPHITTTENTILVEKFSMWHIAKEAFPFTILADKAFSEDSHYLSTFTIQFQGRSTEGCVYYYDALVNLRSCFGYVCAEDAKPTLTTNRTIANNWERFEILPVNNTDTDTVPTAIGYDSLAAVMSMIPQLPGCVGISFVSTTNQFFPVRSKLEQKGRNTDMSWLIDSSNAQQPEVLMQQILKQTPVAKLRSWLDLADVCYEQEKYREAIQHYASFLKDFHHTMLLEQWIALIGCSYGLYKTTLALRDSYQAQAYLQKFLHLSRILLGNQHYYVAIGLEGTAQIMRNTQKYDEAIEVMVECVQIMELAVGKNHPYTGIAYNNLACLYVQEAQYDRACVLFDEVLRVMKLNIGSNAEYVMNALVNMGIMKKMQQQAESAHVLFFEAHQIGITHSIIASKPVISLLQTMLAL